MCAKLDKSVMILIQGAMPSFPVAYLLHKNIHLPVSPWQSCLNNDGDIHKRLSNYRSLYTHSSSKYILSNRFCAQSNYTILFAALSFLTSRAASWTLVACQQPIQAKGLPRSSSQPLLQSLLRHRYCRRTDPWRRGAGTGCLLFPTFFL